jgi:hypothetical protein
MPMGDRFRRRHQHLRLVRSGDSFTSGELDRGEIELELPEPTAPAPPDGEQAEPWAWGDKDMPPGMAERLRLYQEFTAARGGGGGDGA